MRSNAPDQKRVVTLMEGTIFAPVFCIWMFDSLDSSLASALYAKTLCFIRKNIDSCKQSVDDIESILHVELGWCNYLVECGIS